MECHPDHNRTSSPNFPHGIVVRAGRLLRACLVHRLVETRGKDSARGDGGMSTAEYAIGTVSAVAFAAILYAILTSTEVSDTLTGIVVDALQSTG